MGRREESAVLWFLIALAVLVVAFAVRDLLRRPDPTATPDPSAARGAPSGPRPTGPGPGDGLRRWPATRSATQRWRPALAWPHVEAHKVSAWKGRYDIVADGRPVATWDKSAWTSGGTLEIDGRRHDLRANLWHGSWTMTDDAPAPSWRRPRGWAAQTWIGRGRPGHLRVPPRLRGGATRSTLLAAGPTVGSVRRPRLWRADAVADLPGPPARRRGLRTGRRARQVGQRGRVAAG